MFMVKFKKLIVPLLLVCCIASCNRQNTFDESVLEEVSGYSFPLTKEYDVLAYSKERGYFEEMPKQELRTRGYTEFKIHVSRNKKDGYWQIHYQAAGLVPSFSCGYRFNEAGESILSSEPSCGYNK